MTAANGAVEFLPFQLFSYKTFHQTSVIIIENIKSCASSDWLSGKIQKLGAAQSRRERLCRASAGGRTEENLGGTPARQRRRRKFLRGSPMGELGPAPCGRGLDKTGKDCLRSRPVGASQPWRWAGGGRMGGTGKRWSQKNNFTFLQIILIL